MSTRSGKRIHGSFHENNLENDPPKTERKTRGKREKENALDVTVNKSKKRKNYVSFPVEEDCGTVATDAKEPLRVQKTLKEQNLINNNNDIEDKKKTVRQTRRTKRFAENIEDVLQNDTENVVEVNEPNGKKKKKKSDAKTNGDADNVVVETQKSKKKKKKSKQTRDVKNMSVDSFQSAAGSPCKVEHEHDKSKENTQDLKSPKRSSVRNIEKNTFLNNSKRNSIKNSTFEITENITMPQNGAKDSTFDKMEISEEPKLNSTFDKAEFESTKINTTYEKESRVTRKSRPSKTMDIVTVENESEKEAIQSESVSTKSNGNNSTFDVVEMETEPNNTFEKKSRTARKSRSSKVDKNVSINEETSENVVIKSNGKNSTFEIVEMENNTTFEKESRTTKKSKSSKVDMVNNSVNNDSEDVDRKSNGKNSTFDIVEIETKSNTTFEKESRTPRKCRSGKVDMFTNNNKNNSIDQETANIGRKSNGKNTTFDKNDMTTEMNSTYEKTERPTPTTNTTFDKDNNKIDATFETDNRMSLRSSATNSTFDRQSNVTFENKSIDKIIETNSKIISDDDSNLTYDKSDDGSRISITSDDSRVENIINTTPVLIESSMDESTTLNRNTPLKREGTFTKDDPEVIANSSDNNKTPTKRMSLPSPGSTPFPFSKSSQKEKCMLNVTRSLEKAARKTLSLEPVPRMTRVMFCSPVNNPAVVIQQRGKVIKSNLKGSNKSFVFDDSTVGDTSLVRPASRKRSYTHNDVDEARTKRKRLAGEQQFSVERLSRPRTSSAKPPEPTTPSKKVTTPAKSKSETKVSRTKLPNFAALHQRRFAKMESLDECQQRKAQRARQLLTPSAPVNVLLRTSASPRGETDSPKSKEPAAKLAKKTDTPTKPKQSKIDPPKPNTTKFTKPKPINFQPTLPPLDSVKPGFTRFGFKINNGENPFSIPKKPDIKPKDNKPNIPNGVTRQATQPSLVGATTSRREAAKQTVMREKSFTLTERRNEKRKESRTVIKGVRTNRRFELQMKMRNIS